jgi:prolyl-tRNA editing enzyme YbaK/EbsC (Cys-tRNA(Pro) deacylase)
VPEPTAPDADPSAADPPDADQSGADPSAADDPVLRAVAATGQPYRVMDCDPDFADTAAFCERYGIAPEDSANTIVVIGKSDPPRYCACILLATTRLDVNRTVRGLLGTRKASFASADETAAITGMLLGGVTPFGLPADLPLYVDAAVMDRPEVVVGGGSRSRKFLVAPAVLAGLPAASVVDGLAVPIAP